MTLDETEYAAARNTHYALDIDGKSIAYCYIRKNACAAFKRLFEGYSIFSASRSNDQNAMQFMMAFHAIPRERPLSEFDHSFYVYRDPVDRIVSLFKDKFIMRRGNADIFRNYANIVGQDPAQASFSDFITQYLPNAGKKLDPHAIPQSCHLRAERYTDQIPISDLANRLRPIVGDEAVDRYFAKKTNNTDHRGSQDVDGAERLPSEKLHERLRSDGTFPSTQSLVTSEMRQQIERLYPTDARLFGKGGELSRAVAFGAPVQTS